MYMLKRTIAQKRSEKYLAKQKHLAALKWAKEHPVEKKKVTPTPEQIEKRKKHLLYIRRKMMHKKDLEHVQAVKRARNQFNLDKIAAKKLNKKLEAVKKMKKSVRCAIARKAQRANLKIAKVPAILAQKPKPKKAKVEKKETKAQAKK